MKLASHRQTSAPLAGLMPLWDILAAAGLQADAKICLDAGDIASYPGSGQVWADRSAGGYDFFRGTTSGAEGTDPTFTGTAGDLLQGTYFSFDGGDHFDYDAASELFMREWHAASAAFTFLALVYIPPGLSWPSISSAIFATSWNNGPGVLWGLTGSTGRPTLTVVKTAVSNAYYGACDNVLGSGWHVIAITVSDGVAGASFFYKDGAYDPVSANNTPTISYASPSGSGSIGQVPRIGNCDSGATSSGFLASGIRIAGFAAIQRAATKAELDAVFALARLRLGI